MILVQKKWKKNVQKRTVRFSAILAARIILNQKSPDFFKHGPDFFKLGPDFFKLGPDFFKQEVRIIFKPKVRILVPDLQKLHLTIVLIFHFKM